MTLNLNNILCKDCRRKLKIAKRAEKCVRKLTSRKDATFQQKQSWKAVIAKGMLVAPTPAEKRLREMLEIEKDQYRWNLEFQKQVGPYVVDCCIVNRDLVIEADGSVHENRKEYDAARDWVIQREGYAILRFPNDRILNAWPEVRAEIVRFAGGGQ